jgi:hypothetical protein
MNIPVLENSAPTRIGMDGAGVGVPSRDSPAIYFLLRVRRPRGLLKNLITVAWVHGDVAVTVKNDRWDNWPSCSPALVSDPLPCRIAINAEGRSLAAPQARPECMPIAAYKSLYVAPMIAAAAAPAESPPT